MLRELMVEKYERKQEIEREVGKSINEKWFLNWRKTKIRRETELA